MNEDGGLLDSYQIRIIACYYDIPWEPVQECFLESRTSLTCLTPKVMTFYEIVNIDLDICDFDEPFYDAINIELSRGIENI